MIEFKVKNKTINIFNEEIIKDKKVPIIIHNNFKGNGKELWEECVKLNCKDFILANISGIKWNDEMTPWKCEPLYKGDSECKGKADNYIIELTDKIIPEIENRLNYKPLYYGVAGYSLGGLFAIYSIYKTNVFERAMSGSGSFWYPNFVEFIKKNNCINIPEKIYVSLGDKEKNSKIEMLKTVQDNTEEIFEFYKSKGINIFYELNEGGHFRDNYSRIAKGIKYIIE